VLGVDPAEDKIEAALATVGQREQVRFRQGTLEHDVPEEGFDAFAPENTSPLVGYLASPRAERISGYVFIVWNREVKIVSRPGIEEVFESGERWSTDSLHAALSPHFEKREPVTDGYTVPPM